MTNVTGPKGEFIDLGETTHIKCEEIRDVDICTIEFENGKITIREDTLGDICSKALSGREWKK